MKISNLRLINKKSLSIIFAIGMVFIPINSAHADNKTIQLPSIVTNNKTNDSKDSFYIGFPKNTKKTHLLSNDVVMQMMEKKRITPYYLPYNNYPNYTIIINGETYTYRPNDNSFISGKGNIKCRFYATSDNLDEIDNVITIIGGTGSRNRGEDLSNVPLSSNAIIVVCYSGNSDINMIDNANTVAECTKFADYVFLKNPDKICNSIIGTSEGAQTAFVTVANNPGVYQSFVCSNGSAYYDKGRINLIGKFSNSSSYKNFDNMEIIFLESKNNNHWNQSIIQTLHDLKDHGVSMDNIIFCTNDREFIRPIKYVIGEDNFYFLNDAESIKYGNWSKHGDGMNMIINSNVLSYLSDASHTNDYERENNCIYENYGRAKK